MSNVKPASPLVVNEMVQNLLLERTQWLRRLMDPRRDIDAECGHPEEITTAEYRKAFLRGDLAGRVVSVWPSESWSENPSIFETEDQNETEFEKAWTALEKKLRLYSALQRADTLSGIGRFGVILLGIGDGKLLADPVEGVSEKGESVLDAPTAGSNGNGTPVKANQKLLYIRTFDEEAVKVNTLVTDVTNPRFGLPLSYDIQFSDTTATAGATAIASQKVHWSRIIHVADNRMSSDVYGQPRMELVFNRILDVRKIAGGSGEMFWKGGFPGLALETQPSDQPIEIDVEATKKQMDSYMNGLQRYLALEGMTAKSLNTSVADPSPHIEAQVRLISMAMGIPWRVFVGSEQAQLASEQDSRAWHRRLARRRGEYLTPFMILPLVERLIACQVLPKPKEVIVEWPDLNTPSDKEKAEVAEKQTNALAKYAMGGVDALIPPFHYLTIVLGMADDKARSIIDEAVARMEEVDLIEEPPLDPGVEGDAPLNGEPARGRAPIRPERALVP